MKMIQSRQLTTHAYNEETADEIYHDVIDKYYNAFEELAANLQSHIKE